MNSISLMQTIPTSGLDHTDGTGFGSGCAEIGSLFALRGSNKFAPHHKEPSLLCSKDVIIFHVCSGVKRVCEKLS